MRVFVTLDDGLYRALQDRALKRGMSFQAVINEVLADGLVGDRSRRAAGHSKRTAARRPKKGRRGKPASFDELLGDL